MKPIAPPLSVPALFVTCRDGTCHGRDGVRGGGMHAGTARPVYYCCTAGSTDKYLTWPVLIYDIPKSVMPAVLVAGVPAVRGAEFSALWCSGDWLVTHGAVLPGLVMGR